LRLRVEESEVAQRRIQFRREGVIAQGAQAHGRDGMLLHVAAVVKELADRVLVQSVVAVEAASNRVGHLAERQEEHAVAAREVQVGHVARPDAHFLHHVGGVEPLGGGCNAELGRCAWRPAANG
jgi:hypothetical protein